MFSYFCTCPPIYYLSAVDVVETLSWLFCKSKQAMVFYQEDKVLIKVLQQEEGC